MVKYFNIQTCIAALSVSVLLNFQNKCKGDKLICEIGYFPCNDTSNCIRQRENCDGNKNCDDGSDEWNCNNVHDYNYWNQMFQKRPDEDSDKPPTSMCNLGDIPQFCKCSDTRLICNSKGLTKGPWQFPVKSTYLDLSGNLIEMLTNTTFSNLSALRTLLLNNNVIREIQRGSFDCFINLRKLYLTGNKITQIQDDLFYNNEYLQILDLSYNKLELLDAGAFNGLTELQDLNLEVNRLSCLPKNVFKSLGNVRILRLNENKLRAIKPEIFNDLLKLTTMYLTNNGIQLIDSYSFAGMNALQELYCSGNNLEIIENNIFFNLTSLLHLDLSHNKISQFGSATFDPLINLESLNLKGNSLRKVGHGQFQQMKKLRHIYFDDFRMCAYALHVRICEPKGDGISSLENLLDNPVLRVNVWIVAILACVGNVFVFISRLIIKESNLVHSFYIKNLSFADLLMGIYLFFIASYDVHFRGDYIRQDHQWRHSLQCKFCGFLRPIVNSWNPGDERESEFLTEFRQNLRGIASTLSSEASVFTLTTITFDRYFSINQPLLANRRTKKFAFILMSCMWLISITLSLVPILPISYYGDEFYGNNGVCLPLHIHDPYGQAWEYSAIMFIGINSVACAFVSYAYISMFLIIKDSNILLRSTQEKQDQIIAKRFAFIVGTDLVCWVPIIVIKIMALSGIPIKDGLYAWLAVFVLPVNSALNPILYTVTTKLFRQQILRWIYAFKQRSATSCGTAKESSGLSLSYIFFHRASWSKRHIQTNSTARSSIKSDGSKDSMKRPAVSGQEQLVTQV